jgi:LuxR family transcriptional regulator, maltose regulon positive regulatory protein
VLGLLAAGKTNREVAAELYVAEGTVKAHVAGIYRKLGVHSRAEAVSRAADLRLI